MPVFEYRCLDCGRRFSWLHGVVAEEGELACPRCGGAELRKLISRVSRSRSEDERLDSLEDMDLAGLEDTDDPRVMRKFARRLSQEFGDELGEDFDEEMEAAMAEGEGEEGAGAAEDGGESEWG